MDRRQFLAGTAAAGLVMAAVPMTPLLAAEPLLAGHSLLALDEVLDGVVGIHHFSAIYISPRSMDVISFLHLAQPFSMVGNIHHPEAVERDDMFKWLTESGQVKVRPAEWPALTGRAYWTRGDDPAAWAMVPRSEFRPAG